MPLFYTYNTLINTPIVIDKTNKVIIVVGYM